MPPDPPSTSPAVYCYSLPMHLLCNPILDNKLSIMRKLKNADQIYTYLMKLKFTKCIGPNSNCRQLYYTKNTFTLSIKKSSLSCWKNQPLPPPPPPPPPTRKTNGLSLIKKTQSNLESIPPCPLYQVQQQHFKEWPHTLSHIPCISLK